MDCKCFLTTARFLRTEGSQEADFRSAVSRAYYACFLAARAIAFRNCRKDLRLAAGIYKEGGIKHKPLQQYLKDGLADTVHRLGVDLAGLMGSRLDADYEMAKRLGQEDAAQSIEDAEAFLAALAAANPQDIGKAVETYIERTCNKGSGA
ncbi:MAG TPA: HEPN domain-containing protein [Phycisphaerae bacterium]|nr:HEPN domain-containing protein [Phycisphaerae bacterium]